MLFSVLGCLLVFRHGSSFPLNTLDCVLKQLQKLAPELHRVSLSIYIRSIVPGGWEALLHCCMPTSTGKVCW